MIQATITGASQGKDGSVSFQFGKITREFASMAELRMYISRIINVEVAQAIAIGMALQGRDDLSGATLARGKTVTLDLSQETWGARS